MRALVLLTYGLAGCGECVFTQTVEGTILAGSRPVENARVSTCDAPRCGWSEEGCVDVSTDAEGRFQIEVPQCRPGPARCALAPIRVEADGCTPIDLYLDLESSPVRIELDCG